MKLSSTTVELGKIGKVIERMENESRGIKFDPFTVIYALDIANSNGTKLDFDKLLKFNSISFWHDVLGIFDNINMKTGDYENCFLPRCSVSEKGSSSN